MLDHPARTPRPSVIPRCRRRRALALVPALLLVLSACDVWEQAGRLPDASRFNPDETTITPANVGSLSVAWTTPDAGTFSEPLLSGGTLYATVNGAVRAYDAATGAVLWTAGAGGSPVLAGGDLWTVTNGPGSFPCPSVLARLDPATGSTLSTQPAAPGIVGQLVASGTTFAYTTRSGCGATTNQVHLAVQDTSDPATAWTFSLPDGANPFPPSIGGGKIYVAADAQVYAFDAAGCGAPTCSPVWTKTLDIDHETAGQRPVVGPDGTVYLGTIVGNSQTLVEALDGDTGAPLWRTDMHSAPGPGWQNLALAHGLLYVSDQRNSSPSNALEVFAAGGCGQPVCAPVWSAALDAIPSASLAVGGDVLYVGELRFSGNQGTGRLVAFDANGCGAAVCPRIGGLDLGSKQPLQLAVAGGRVAVVEVGQSTAALRVLTPAA